MADRDYLRLDSGDSAVVTLDDDARGRAVELRNRYGERYTAYMYDILVDHKQMSLSASPGLHKELQALNARSGDTIVIARTGTGKSTAWDVNFSNDADRAPGGDSPSRAASSAPARSSMSYPDVLRLYGAILADCREEAPEGASEDAIRMTAGNLLIACAITGARPDDLDNGTDVKLTPQQYISSIFRKAGIHPTVFEDVAQAMLKTSLSSATREHAAILFRDTKNGAELQPVREAYDALQELPADDDLPF